MTEAFTCPATKNGKVFIAWQGRPVTTLAGERARLFKARAEGLGGEALQLVMARATGNFKRGNER